MYDPNFPPPVTSDPLVPPPPVAAKQSGVGIASVVIGILSLIMVCVTFAIAGGSGGVSEYSASYENLMTGIGLLACGTIALTLVGVVLGIVGVVQKNVKKVFAIIGLASNGVVLLALCAVIAIGMLAMQ